MTDEHVEYANCLLTRRQLTVDTHRLMEMYANDKERTDTTITDLTRQHAAHIETTFLQAILATDWDDTPVLDIIIAHPTPQLTTVHTGDTSRQSIHGLDTRIEVTRHTRRAPPLADVAIPDRRCDIYRLTRPLLEHHRDALERAGYAIDALL